MGELRCGALILLLSFAATPAFAHGEQVLVFPASFLLLLVLALVIMAIRWHALWARALTALGLLASNVALWFLPIIPHTAGDLASASLGTVMLMLLVIPMLIAAVLVAVTTRIGRGPVA